VAKKEKHCNPDDPADCREGDNCDHVAYDPEYRLVVSVVPGKKHAKATKFQLKNFLFFSHFSVDALERNL